MTPPLRPAWRRRRCASLLLGLLSALAALQTGCAASGPQALAQEDPGGDLFPELRSLERQQLRRPDVQAQRFGAAQRQEQTAANAADPHTLQAPLASVVEAYAQRLQEIVGTLEPTAVDAEARTAALKLYIQGRARLLAGEPQQALADLRLATQRDPTAAAPWRALGEASLLLGDRFGATTAFRQALRRDPTDLESLVRLGLLRKDAQAPEEAATLLSAAVRALPADDPALTYVAPWALGEALWALGYAQAAQEALLQALALPDTWRAPTRYNRALAQLARSRSALWLRVSQARSLLGDREGALQAALQAAATPSVDPYEALQQAVQLALSLGRSAQAARIALKAALADAGGADQRVQALVQLVANHSSLRPLLVRLLRRLAREPSGAAEQTAQTAQRLLAAIMTDEEAIAALLQQLQNDPADEAALWSLARRLPSLSPQEQTRTAATVVARAPWQADAWGRVLLSTPTPLAPLLDALRSAAQQDAAAALVYVATLEALGRHDEASAALDDALASSPNSRTLLYAKASRLARFGAWETAAEILQGLAPPRDALETLRSGLVAVQTFQADAARRLLEPLSRDEAQPLWLRVEALQALAQAAADQGLRDEAAELLERAMALAPHRESVYAQALQLAAPSGQAPNAQQLRAVLRRLRSVRPGAAVLRWLSVQELLQNDELEHAVRLLQSLAVERFEETALAQLGALWSRMGATAQGLAWVEEQLAGHPNLPALKALKGRVLADSGAVEQARAWLESTLAQHPQHPLALQAMEQLLRDTLRRPLEAARLSLKRLEAQPLTFASLLERAQAGAALGLAAQQMEALSRAVDWPAALSPAQRAALSRQATALAQQTLEQGAPPIGAALALFERVGARLERLPPVAALAWVELVVRDDDSDAQALARAALSVRDDKPADAAQVYGVALNRAIEAGRADLAAQAAIAIDQAVKLRQPDVLALWAQAASMARDLPAALAALTAIEREGAALAIVSRLARVEHKPASEREAVAELAYQLSGAFYLTQQKAYEQLLEFALSRHPDHILANNDLGYLLADRGEQLDRALAMLERAYALDPHRAAVVDSLAWARYKLGQLQDAEGVEGAVTLLRKAIRLPEGRDDPVLRDHLGDALWRVGLVQEAQAQWRVARSLAQARLAQGATSPVDAQTLEAVERKLEAASMGRQPPLAPLAVSSQNETISTRASSTSAPRRRCAAWAAAVVMEA